MTAPQFRAVDQFSGSIAEAAKAIDRLTGERDDARTQRDNMVDLTIEVGRLGAYLKDALAENRSLEAERDDAERECEELREALDAARCRLQELEGSDRQRADDV